jgi:PAS domain S-box-containing protein
MSIAFAELDGERCIVGHIHDITEARRLDGQLRESEARFRQLTETLRQGFLLRELQPPAVLYASPAMQDIFGLDRDSLLHDPSGLEKLIHPDERRQIVTLRETMTTTTDFEYRIVRPDGQIRWIRSRAAPVRMRDGQMTRVASVSEDVTEERKLRESLRGSEARFRLLAESSTDVISRSSPDGTIEYMSPASRALYGYEPEEMVGRPGWEFIHPEDHARLSSQPSGCVSAAGDVTNIYRVRRKDGGHVWVEAKTVALSDPRGEIVEFHTSARDISDRKEADAVVRRAKEGAERANLAKSEFLSRMSHELRTPLHAILGFGELLAREDLSPAQGDALEQITKGGRHLLELINEVLDISAIERGELRLSLEPVHVGTVVHEALDMDRPAGRRPHDLAGGA